MAYFFKHITAGLLLGLGLSATGFGTPAPRRSAGDKPAPGNMASATLVSAVTSLSADQPGLNGSVPEANPTARWGTGTTSLAPALLQSIIETKLRGAARTAYLQAEGLAYGVNVSAGAQADRDTAAGVFNYLDSRNNYVETL